MSESFARRLLISNAALADGVFMIVTRDERRKEKDHEREVEAYLDLCEVYQVEPATDAIGHVLPRSKEARALYARERQDMRKSQEAFRELRELLTGRRCLSCSTQNQSLGVPDEP